MTWYELIPLTGADDDQTAFLRRARRAAESLGLTSRPSWDSMPGLLRRDDGLALVASGPRRWVCLPDGAEGDAAGLLAHACDASARECGRPDILDEPLRWAHAVVPASASLSRSQRDELEQDDDMRLNVPGDGLVYLNARRQGIMEIRRNKDWLGDEFNMSPDASKLAEPGVALVRVGAAMPDARRALDQAMRAGNALDTGLSPGLAAHASRPALGLLLLSLLADAVAALAVVFAPAVWSIVLTSLTAAATLAAGVRWVRAPGDADLWVRPRHRWWWARSRRANANDHKTRMAGDDDAKTKKTMHAYTFQRSSIPCPPGTLAAFCRPVPGAEGEHAELSLAPGSLAGAEGPRVGVDRDGTDVRLPAGSLWGGTMLFGNPGGGKSNLMHGLEGYAAGHMGDGDVTLVFESKGVDGIPVIRRLCPQAIVADLAGDTPMPDLLGGGDDAERAESFAALMRGALGETQIGPASRMMLRDGVWLALRCMKAERFGDACAAVGVRRPRDWADMAFTLLGGRGVDTARGLARACMSADGDAEVRQAVERLHGGTTASGRPAVPDGQLAQRMNAPMNKMSLLVSAPSLTDPKRPRFTWDSMFAQHEPVMLAVNLGEGLKGGSLGEDAKKLTGALLFQSLRLAVERRCAGWQDKGRHVRVFIDELTDVLGGDGTMCGGNTAAVEWLRSRGRAYGVELTCGTQYPEQMDRRTMSLTLGFDTTGTFALRSMESAAIVADGLGVEPDTIRRLPRFAICLETLDPQRRQLPAMTLSVPHFDAGAPV